MFTTLADNSKAAIFTVIVLLLAVTVAASISLFSITSEFLFIVLYMFTPALMVLIMMLVVTRDGFSREGWKLLGLHRLGLKAWWIAFLLPLVVGVGATALVWATPLASFVVPDYGMGGATIDFTMEVVLATLTFSLGEELGWRGYLLPRGGDKFAGFRSQASGKPCGPSLRPGTSSLIPEARYPKPANRIVSQNHLARCSILPTRSKALLLQSVTSI